MEIPIYTIFFFVPALSHCYATPAYLFKERVVSVNTSNSVLKQLWPLLRLCDFHADQ